MSKDPKLSELTPQMAAKIQAVLADVASQGYTPVIVEARRTVAQQRDKVRRGVSRTMASPHLLGQAVDIVQKGKGWNSPRGFWLTLGRCAILHGLEWGGMWIGSRLNPRDQRLRKALHTFCVDKSRPWRPQDYEGKLGWDVAHVQL